VVDWSVFMNMSHPEFYNKVNAGNCYSLQVLLLEKNGGTESAKKSRPVAIKSILEK